MYVCRLCRAALRGKARATTRGDEARGNKAHGRDEKRRSINVTIAAIQHDADGCFAVVGIMLRCVHLEKVLIERFAAAPFFRSENAVVNQLIKVCVHFL